MPGYCTDGSCLGAFHDSCFALSRVPRSAYICSHCVSGTVCARLCASDGILRLSSTAFDRQQVACISSAGEGISRGSRGRPGRWQSAGSAQMKLRKSASRGSRIKTGKSAFKQAVLLILSQNGGLKTDFAVICRSSRQGQRERSASSTAWCRRCENENRFRIRG